MTTPTPTTHAHPLARAATIDFGIVVLAVGTVLLTFLTGQGVARWHNLVFAPIVFVLAALTVRLVVAEIRAFARSGAESGHRVEAASAVAVALIAMVVVAPMLLVMPIIFFGALV